MSPRDVGGDPVEGGGVRREDIQTECLLAAQRDVLMSQGLRTVNLPAPELLFF
jgi:hypothetical protein